MSFLMHLTLFSSVVFTWSLIISKRASKSFLLLFHAFLVLREGYHSDKIQLLVKIYYLNVCWNQPSSKFSCWSSTVERCYQFKKSIFIISSIKHFDPVYNLFDFYWKYIQKSSNLGCRLVQLIRNGCASRRNGTITKRMCCLFMVMQEVIIRHRLC